MVTPFNATICISAAAIRITFTDSERNTIPAYFGNANIRKVNLFDNQSNDNQDEKKTAEQDKNSGSGGYSQSVS
jgi:hypothetical protein